MLSEQLLNQSCCHRSRTDFEIQLSRGWEKWSVWPQRCLGSLSGAWVDAGVVFVGDAGKEPERGAPGCSWVGFLRKVIYGHRSSYQSYRLS